MSALGPLIRSELDNLLQQGPSGPAPSVGQAAAISAAAIATYTAAEATLVAEEAIEAAALAVQLVLTGEGNSPRYLQDSVEALTKQIALASEVLVAMEGATDAVLSGMAE